MKLSTSILKLFETCKVSKSSAILTKAEAKKHNFTIWPKQKTLMPTVITIHTQAAMET